MYLPLKTGASYTYPPTVVFLSLRASKSELEDVVFLVEWLGANYKLYSEVSYNLSTFLGFPFVLRSISCMVCGNEGPGVPSNVPVITWIHMQVMQQYLIESNTHEFRYTCTVLNARLFHSPCPPEIYLPSKMYESRCWSQLSARRVFGKIRVLVKSRNPCKLS